MNRIIAAIMITAVAGSAAAAAPVMTDTGRNPHKYTLKLDLTNFVNGDWRGDADFTISACPQATCFHLSGHAVLPLSPVTSLNEGEFPVPGLACKIHFQEVPHGDMDSGDWRITLIGGKGCSSLPAGLAGVYKKAN
jgi:hypothetical protein